MSYPAIMAPLNINCRKAGYYTYAYVQLSYSVAGGGSGTINLTNGLTFHSPEHMVAYLEPLIQIIDANATLTASQTTHKITLASTTGNIILGWDNLSSGYLQHRDYLGFTQGNLSGAKTYTADDRYPGLVCSWPLHLDRESLPGKSMAVMDCGDKFRVARGIGLQIASSALEDDVTIQGYQCRYRSVTARLDDDNEHDDYVAAFNGLGEFQGAFEQGHINVWDDADNCDGAPTTYGALMDSEISIEPQRIAEHTKRWKVAFKIEELRAGVRI